MKTLRSSVARIALQAIAALAVCQPQLGAQAGVPLRVMTFNIHGGQEGLTNVAATIREAAPDIVGLQEVDVHWADRSSFVDEADSLARACGMQVRFGPIYELPALSPGAPAREFGVAILSRRPIVRSENHEITRLSTQADLPPQIMPGFLQVTLDVGGSHVDVFDTHLDYRRDPAVRQTQVAEMLGIIGKVGGPAILVGDMNASPEAGELAPLFQTLTDAWTAGSGPGFTYPASAPAERIDYVLFTGGIRVRSARVVATQASDHRPLVADLEIAPGS